MIGVVNSKNKFPAILPGPQPVEKSGSHATNMHVSGGAGSKSCADVHVPGRFQFNFKGGRNFRKSAWDWPKSTRRTTRFKVVPETLYPGRMVVDRIAPHSNTRPRQTVKKSGHRGTLIETCLTMARQRFARTQSQFNCIDQSCVMDWLTKQLEEASSVGVLSTQLAGSVSLKTLSLTLFSAGHPLPPIFRSGSQTRASRTGGYSDDYRQSNIPFELFDFYGKIVRDDGITNVAKSISCDFSGDFVRTLQQRIRAINPKNRLSADTTVTLARPNKERVSLKKQRPCSPSAAASDI